MKKVPCSYDKCGERRVHWCDPDTPRVQQMIEVADDHAGEMYCSITCAVMGGYMKLKPDETTDEHGLVKPEYRKKNEVSGAVETA